MSRAILEDELGGTYGACSTSESRGIKEHILECEGQAGVFWDLLSDGEFNWEVPLFNIVGDQDFTGNYERVGDGVHTGNTVNTGHMERVGNEKIEGYKTFINITAPAVQGGVTLYSNANRLYAKTTDGQVYQIAPYDSRLLSLANNSVALLNLL